MRHRREGLPALVTLVLTLGLCLGLYQADNKYTHPGPQPISGVLYPALTEDGTAALHYLVRDWVFYPDRLLTPAQAELDRGYRRYVDVGADAAMGHGCGTYALTLMLPEEEGRYALELPEICSACRLYVDGQLLLQLGVPEAEGYTDRLGSRLVSFSAAGETRLLLQAADRSGVYSGLTYPPAFGGPDQLLAARDGRLFLHGTALLLAVLAGALALSFGLREHRLWGLLLALACVCLAVITGYPLLHGLTVTAFQPWYTLEAVCYYALLLAAVLLQARWVLSPGKGLLLAAPCALGTVLALVYFGGAALWPSWAGAAFSLLSLGVKCYAAACLLGLSVLGLRRQTAHGAFSLCGSVALAVCLLCDRLLPLYEPILGGWFAELGGVLLMGLLGASLWLRALDAYRFRLRYQEGFAQMERRLDLQRDHYRQLQTQIQRSREASHDLRHHMRALRALADQGKLEELTAYLDAYEPHLAEGEVRVWCRNPTADAVLAYYAGRARELGAEYDAALALPEELDFPQDELCILLGNLLENALEAMARQTDLPRRLYLRGTLTEGQLRLVVDNSFDGVVRRQDRSFLSTKHPGLGLGISSVEAITARHGGLADFSPQGTTFHVSLLLPMDKP